MLDVNAKIIIFKAHRSQPVGLIIHRSIEDRKRGPYFPGINSQQISFPLPRK